MHQKLSVVTVIFLSLGGLSLTALSAVAEPEAQVIKSDQLVIQQPLPPLDEQPTGRLGFGLPDGTPIKLKFKEEVSSKTAQPNQAVTFEVTEDVKVEQTTVIAKGATARGAVADVQRPGWLGRKGKLAIALKDVDLVSRERVVLRSYQSGGQANTLGTIAGIINPIGGLIKGSNVTYPAGAELTAFVDGNFALNPVKFGITPPKPEPKQKPDPKGNPPAASNHPVKH